MPDELFKFMKNGVASETGSSYNVKNVNIATTTMRKLLSAMHAKSTNAPTVGAKVKALV